MYTIRIFFSTFLQSYLNRLATVLKQGLSLTAYVCSAWEKGALSIAEALGMIRELLFAFYKDSTWEWFLTNKIQDSKNQVHPQCKSIIIKEVTLPMFLSHFHITGAIYLEYRLGTNSS